MDGMAIPGFEVRSLHPLVGAEVAGLDLAERLLGPARSALGRLLAERGVLVFRGQNLDPPAFARAVANFGELLPPLLPGPRVRNLPVVGFVSNVGVGRAGCSGPFGTDLSNLPAPPLATALYGVSVSPSGGDIQFVHAQAAYDALPPGLKTGLTGLKSLHTGPARAPETVQPLVVTHPVTGRRGLFLDLAHMRGIVGMEREAADALIADLMARAVAGGGEYRHRWRVGDLVIWDNRTVLRKGNTDVAPPQRVYLYRAMVRGTPLS